MSGKNPSCVIQLGEWELSDGRKGGSGQSICRLEKSALCAGRTRVVKYSPISVAPGSYVHFVVNSHFAFPPFCEKEWRNRFPGRIEGRGFWCRQIRDNFQ